MCVWRWWSPSHPCSARGVAAIRRTFIPSSAFAKRESCIVYHIAMIFKSKKRPQKGFEA
jgi:hypothetical protein